VKSKCWSRLPLGKSNKEIAELLFISEGNGEDSRASIHEKSSTCGIGRVRYGGDSARILRSESFPASIPGWRPRVADRRAPGPSLHAVELFGEVTQFHRGQAIQFSGALIAKCSIATSNASAVSPGVPSTTHQNWRSLASMPDAKSAADSG